MLGFVPRRFTATETFGLSLAAGWAVILFGGWAFGEITDHVIDREALATTDSPVTGWLAAHRLDWLTGVLRVATHLGAFWFAVPLALLAAVLLTPPARRRWTVARTLAATVGTSLLVNGIKLLVGRPRPTLTEVIATATGYAFPSGHSAQALAAYATLAYLLGQRFTGWRPRLVGWAAAGLIVAVVGFSRLYLGVHWLTDVLGGYLLAAVWLATVHTTAATARAAATRRARIAAAAAGPTPAGPASDVRAGQRRPRRS